MRIGLIIALVLAVYVGYLLWRAPWTDRVGVLAAIGLGFLLPQVLGALSDVARSAASSFTAVGW